MIDCLVKIGMAPSISIDEYVRKDERAEMTWQVACQALLHLLADCFTVRRRVVRDGKEQKATQRYSSGDDIQADDTEGWWDE